MGARFASLAPRNISPGFANAPQSRRPVRSTLREGHQRSRMSPQGSIYEGKTREEAVDKGLRELRMDRADVYGGVVEEGSSGFLGFGGRPYRVRLIPRVRRAERPPRGERAARGGSERGRAEEPRSEDRRRDSGR